MDDHMDATGKNKVAAIVFSLIPAALGEGEGGSKLFFKKFFLYVILKLYAEFQFPTMPATGQQVCGGVVWWVWWWLKPILHHVCLLFQYSSE